LGFGPSFLHKGTKRHANFFGKKMDILHFGFWPKEAKKPKRAPRDLQ